MKQEYNNNTAKAKEKSSLADDTKYLSEYGTTGDGDHHLESGTKKIPYPKSVFFIITNEFCERFSYYGMKAVLTLYLKNVLEYSEDSATVIYHVFSMLCYFTPIFGAMLADSLLGKFKTILYLSVVYAIGNVVLSLSAITPIAAHIPQGTISIIGLLLIALGTGGIKPCVAAFGGDQFTLPQQALQLSSFFSVFYFSINAGSLLSTFITPIFRKDVTCFNEDTCYPLAFGVPAVLMVVSLLVFVIGKPWYNCRKPEGNITVEVGKCITYALRKKSSDKKEHWLDHASDKYDADLISSIKTLLKILVLFLPLPVFWALFDQQGSRWTFQATRMNGELFGYTIKPDQMQVLNPFLILALIPLFDQVVYPAFAKFNLLKKQLQRLATGGVLAGVAFVVSGFLEIQLESTYAVKLGPTEAHLNFVNNINCPLNFQLGSTNATIEPMGQYIVKQIEAGPYTAQISGSGECASYGSASYKFDARAKEAMSYAIFNNSQQLSVKPLSKPDELTKDGEGASLIKLVFVGFEDAKGRNGSLRFKLKGNYVDVWKLSEEKENAHGKKPKPAAMKAIPVADFDTGVYKMDPFEHELELIIPPVEAEDISRMNISIGKIHPKQGGNYLYVITRQAEDVNGTTATIIEHLITTPNSIHMLWLIPQFVIITVAEVMFSITGLEFAFSQAPASMKSVVQAAWLLTVAFGNVIVVFIAEFKIFEEQYKEFFLYSGLMFVDIIIFSIIAYFYKPTIVSDKKNEDADVVEMKESRRGPDNDP